MNTKTKTVEQIIEQIEGEVIKEPQKCIVCESCDVDWELSLTSTPPYYSATCEWCGSSWIECLAFSHIENLEFGEKSK